MTHYTSYTRKIANHYGPIFRCKAKCSRHLCPLRAGEFAHEIGFGKDLSDECPDYNPENPFTFVVILFGILTMVLVTLSTDAIPALWDSYQEGQE